MSCYITHIKRDTELCRDIKELIPDMNTRRRMSSLIKMAVTTGMEVLANFQASQISPTEQESEREQANHVKANQIDAIITASKLGCISDSEKFLANIIDNDEQMLNPTPFIQSTFNTVGSQIALLKRLNCHNMTYSHRDRSLESAIIDAFIRLKNGSSKHVLIGYFDESTPTVEKIMNRMRREQIKAGALFFIMSKEKIEENALEIQLEDLICDKISPVVQTIINRFKCI